MPVYNTQVKHLKAAIDSILNQSFMDFEFLIIDDGSTNPDVSETIKKYKDERIKYFFIKNGGIARALNYGLKQAKGEYIARMDSDDISLPDRFAKQVKFLDENQDISVLGAWFDFFPESHIIQHPLYPDIYDFIQACCIGHPTVMWRRQDFKKHKLKYNPDYRCEDYELWSRAVRVLKFANLPEVLLKYRWEGQNISVKKEAEIIADSRRVQRQIKKFLKRDRKKKKIFSLLSRLCFWKKCRKG